MTGNGQRGAKNGRLMKIPVFGTLKHVHHQMHKDVGNTAQAGESKQLSIRVMGSQSRAHVRSNSKAVHTANVGIKSTEILPHLSQQPGYSG